MKIGTMVNLSVNIENDMRNLKNFGIDNCQLCCWQMTEFTDEAAEKNQSNNAGREDRNHRALVRLERSRGLGLRGRVSYVGTGADRLSGTENKRFEKGFGFCQKNRSDGCDNALWIFARKLQDGRIRSGGSRDQRSSGIL